MIQIENPVQPRKKSKSFNFDQFMKKMPFQECSNSRKCSELEFLLDSQICKLSDRLQYIENSINRTKSRISAENTKKKLTLDFALNSGEPLGLSTGEIGDDQIEVSDSTAPELKAPRLGFSNWNSISGNSWVKISFRRQAVIKSIGFLSPETQVGSLMMVTSAKLAYLSLKGDWRKLDQQISANTKTEILESTALNNPTECLAVKIFPKAGFGREALHFQMELFGSYADLGSPLGLASGEIKDESIFVSTAEAPYDKPRLGVSRMFQVFVLPTYLKKFLETK